jgi:16S rRNA (cytosine967-C5)-methyltransferase
MDKAARLAAVNALFEVNQKGAYADSAIKKALADAHPDARDAALASRIFYGTLQNRLLIDHYLAGFSNIRLKKIHPRVLEILRTGAYQLLMADRVPGFAAVNESVELAKATGNFSAAGFVNALLRRLSDAAKRGALPEIAGEWDERMSVMHSHPLELVRLFEREFGREGAEALLKANNRAPETALRVNALKASPEEAVRALEAEGCAVKRDEDLENCLYIAGGGEVGSLSAFKDGLVAVQDKASQLCARALGAEAGELIIDGCAAPGGKTFALAALAGDKAKIIACDIYEKKLGQIRINAQRLGINSVETALSGGQNPLPEYIGKADRVLADVPCSGLGIIRKKPDIRYKDVLELETLTETQLGILEGLARYVRPGGVLVYSTCTLLSRENGEVVGRFLERNTDFEPEAFFTDMDEKYRASAGRLTLLPHVHGIDGFFICKMRRRA